MTKNEAIQKVLLLEAANANLEKRNQALQIMCDSMNANAPWLTIAHTLCTDQGVAQGHISQRLFMLNRKLRGEND